MRTSIASRIRLLVAALCVGFGVSVLSAFYFLAQRQINDTARNDSQSASAMLTTMIKGRGDLLDSLTYFIATRPHMRDLALLTDRPTVTDALTAFQKDAGIDALAMTDRDGKPLGE